MNTSKSINETTKLLCSILSYCEKNNLTMWGEHTPTLMKVFVGDQSDFLNYKAKSNYSVINFSNEDIEQFNLELGFNSQNESLSCIVIPKESWNLGDGKHHAEIYVHAFWENNKEIMKRFSNQWLIHNLFNFNHALKYATEMYPEGFCDRKIYPYSSEKNWIHFLEVLPKDCVQDFAEDRQRMQKFHENLIELRDEGAIGKLNAYSFIKNFLEKIPKFKFSENAQVYISHILIDIVSEDLQPHFAEKFPFMKKLLENESKENLVVQTNSEIIEKLVLSKFDIFASFKSSKLSAKHLLEISLKVLKEIGTNDELKSNGLDGLSIYNEEISCFLIFKDNKVLNNVEIAKIFVECMSNCINNTVCLLDDPEKYNPEYNNEYIKDVIKSTVSHYLLSKQMITNKCEPLKSRHKL